jgi:hypothetical protein
LHLSAAFFIRDGMSDPEQPKETRPQRATAKSQAGRRAAALEKALRENLRRRKAAQPEMQEPSALRATDSESPSRSEALGQEQKPSRSEALGQEQKPSRSEALGQEKPESLHEKGKENPEDDA